MIKDLFVSSNHETVKSQVKSSVYTIVQSVPSWYKQRVALFTALFHSNRCLDSEDFFTVK